MNTILSKTNSDGIKYDPRNSDGKVSQSEMGGRTKEGLEGMGCIQDN